MLIDAAATLNQIDPQVVHVRGAQGMFSCYGSAHMVRLQDWRSCCCCWGSLIDRGLYLWADSGVLQRDAGVDLELFDCFEADRNIEPITGELHRILDANQGGKRRYRPA